MSPLLLAASAYAGTLDLLALAQGEVPAGWTVREVWGRASVRQETVAGQSAVCLRSADASFSINRTTPGWDLTSYPFLEWSWLVETHPTGGDAGNSDKNDQAAQVFAGFTVGFLGLSTAALSWIWDVTRPRGWTAEEGYPGAKVYVEVVESGAGNTGTWRNHRVNVRDAAGTRMGKDLAEVAMVRFQVNSQKTDTSASGCLRYLRATSG